MHPCRQPKCSKHIHSWFGTHLKFVISLTIQECYSRSVWSSFVILFSGQSLCPSLPRLHTPSATKQGDTEGAALESTSRYQARRGLCCQHRLLYRMGIGSDSQSPAIVESQKRRGWTIGQEWRMHPESSEATRFWTRRSFASPESRLQQNAHVRDSKLKSCYDKESCTEQDLLQSWLPAREACTRQGHSEIS